MRRSMTRGRELSSDDVPRSTCGSVCDVRGANTRLGNVPLEDVADNAFLGWSRPTFHEQIYIKQ